MTNRELISFAMMAASVVLGCQHASPTPSETPSGYGLMGAVPRRCPTDECKKCDISALAHAEAGPGALDCGWSRNDSQREPVVRCALDAAAGSGRFVAIESLQGIDSFIVEAFARGKDGRLVRFWYDSDVTGAACPCTAVVRRHPCSSALKTEPQEPDALGCDVDKEAKGELVCEEPGHAQLK
jgi:hypothetical protein